MEIFDHNKENLHEFLIIWDNGRSNKRH